MTRPTPALRTLKSGVGTAPTDAHDNTCTHDDR